MARLSSWGSVNIECNVPLIFIFQIKTQMQAQSSSTSIAVGHQHRHAGMIAAIKTIYVEHGIPGLWRGVTVAMSRVMVGSAVQLSTFSNTKEYIVKRKVNSVLIKWVSPDIEVIISMSSSLLWLFNWS